MNREQRERREHRETDQYKLSQVYAFRGENYCEQFSPLLFPFQASLEESVDNPPLSPYIRTSRAVPGLCDGSGDGRI